MNKNTTIYANTIRDFLSAAKAVEEKYQPKIAEMQKFKDSQFGRDEVQRFKAELSGALESVRERFKGKTAGIVGNMKNEIDRKLSTPPTAEQVATLQLLAMREHLTAEELKAVVPSLAGCPMALKVLDELSHKHSLTGLNLPTTPSEKWLNETFEALERNAEKLFYRYGKPEWTEGDFVSTLINKRLEAGGDDAEIIRVFGAVTDFPAFAAAVDGEG